MPDSKNVETIDGRIAVETFFPDTVKFSTPLLFIHGSSCGSWIWDNFTRYFTSAGWICHALNLRGHHLSREVKDWGEVGVSDYLEDIDKVVSHIGKNIVLIGHSMGGVLSQKYAETQNPLKLILLHTSPPRQVVKKIDFNSFIKRGEEKGRTLGQKVLQSDSDPTKLIGYMFDPGNVEEDVLNMTHKKMGKESARAILEMKDVEVDAEKIKCPVYVLGFNLEKIGLHYPINLSDELARYYSAREYQVIEPGGHLFMLEKNWEEFAQLLDKWLLD